MQRIVTIFLVCILLQAGYYTAFTQDAPKVMIVVIDGARYTETFGDPSYSFIPRMKEISSQGTIVSNFKNDGYTYTSRAIPALWCGAWTGVQSITYQGLSTQYTTLPSIFEYYRKQKDKPSSDCYYIMKYIQSLWLPSFDADYGEDYWPKFSSNGRTDRDVANRTQQIMDSDQPNFLWVYLADVDHAGHSGNWDEYTQAISTADSIVGVLWDKVQSHPFYQNSTTLLVTNDHGRHDDAHGGFKNHGCSCDGCRHIQFLAVGPNIKANFTSMQPRVLPDFAVTASSLLGINPEKATGNVMHEIFNTTSSPAPSENVTTYGAYPNPLALKTTIKYSLHSASMVNLDIYSLSGAKVISLVHELQAVGDYAIEWSGVDANGQRAGSGFYLYRLVVDGKANSGKIILVDNI